jgi:hypothetical protein
MRRSGSDEPHTRSPARQPSGRPLPPQGQALDRRQRYLRLKRRTGLLACLRFLRVCFMSCSLAIGASSGQGSTLTNCLVSRVHLS